ncbi:MAG: DUF998 domain-containing protein [Nitrososphaerales archaeon]
MARSPVETAGLLLFAGGAQFILALTVAEALFPGYSVSGNRISDLGADCNPSCAIIQPSATFFDASVFLLGLAGLAAGYLIYSSRYRVLGSLMTLASLGAMGVGVFPETTGDLHVLFSFLAFFFTGLAAFASYRIVRRPLSFLSAALGAVTLVALGLYAAGVYLGLGPGGMERMVAYPAVIWVIGAGANLMGGSSTERPKSLL